MIVDKIIGNLKEIDVTGKKIEFVPVDWYDQDKKILKKKLDSGEEIGIRISGHLHDKDILFQDQERVIAIDILPCDMIVVSISDILEMGRVCFELGNRHLPLEIEENCVKLVYDKPTFEYLEKLKFDVQRQQGKFTHYMTCKGHQHEHH